MGGVRSRTRRRPSPSAHDPALRPHQVVRRSRAVRRGHLADRRPRARGPLRAERRRQDDAAQDAGGHRRARRRRRRQAGGPHDRVSPAGRPGAQGAHRVRGSVARLRAAAGDEGGDARARGAHGRAGGDRGRPGADARSVQRVERSLPPRRGLQHRPAGGDGAHRPRVLARGFRSAGRHVLRRLADAHRARQAAAGPARPAAAGRADQPPRPRGPQLARELPARVPARGHARRATIASSSTRSSRASPI